MGIDTSKLEALLKEQIDFAKALLAKGEKATKSEIDALNSRAGKILKEWEGISGKIKMLPALDEETKTRMSHVISLCKILDAVLDQMEAMGIITRLGDSCDSVSRHSSGDDSCCMCNDPDLQITLPPNGIPGYANCKKCNKSIGVVRVRDGEVSVMSNNPVAKEKIERMVKGRLSK